MSGHDILLLCTALGGVLMLIALITSKLRMHPFLALLVTSVAVGLVAGLSTGDLIDAIEDGAGNTFGNVGLVVALGAMLGRLLSDSGATDRIAQIVIGEHTGRAAPWLVAIAAFVIGIPMFFEVGLVMLLPLLFSIALRIERAGRLKGSGFAWVAIPAIASLSALHGMVPPHPGPLTAISTIGADLGLTMIYGLIAAVPAVILAGPVYARFVAPRLHIRPDAALVEQFTGTAQTSAAQTVEAHVGGSASASKRATGDAAGGVANVTKDHEDAPVAQPEQHPVSFVVAIVATLIPVVLMLFRTLTATLLSNDSVTGKVAGFVGNPVVAMLIGVLVALVMLGYGRGTKPEQLRKWLGSSLKPIAGILLIIAGGGAFNKVLIASGVGDAIMHMASNWALSAVVLGWVIAALLSVSTGSATVGIVGASGLVAPLAAADPTVNLALLVVAIGSGSIFFNYANHAGFWLVKESFGMTMGETFKTITVVQTIVGLIGLVVTFALSLIVGLPG
ncbi:GntP family permease [Pseudoclavibacter sp. CFCC 13611]|uniref:GntP family permease n=1 Tax=Pseudoclavibacter sp. CFCC 13611 TaxID=2615178 RepID=UPI0013019176|nr:SLC13 family permease [Pseudoclavibacter sp. CFCC 13611]KAB1664174.1 gluconate transporter [Pseudoclavibacter sp. CFCC 13611]